MIRWMHISRWIAAVLTIAAAMASCTLDITTPVEAPPDTWDPASNTHPDGQAFQELLNHYAHKGLPGVVLFVRTPEGLWNGAAGYAKIESGDRMQPTHRHHAASVTKMYTATAVMLLAEDGLIDLDARISQYLPEHIYKPIPNAGKSTVRQLLGHTSGIPDFGGSMAYDLDLFNDPMGSYSPDRLLSYIHDQTPIFQPGDGYFYSNANYLLLALLIDHVTGTNHGVLISERILKLLGLDSTYYKNEPEYPKPPGLVNSYEDIAGDGRMMNVTDITIHNTEIFLGNAGLIASSADYAAFIEALFGGQLIGEALLADMQEWRDPVHYGLGLNYIETPYGIGIGHGGGDFGVRSEVRYFPDVNATLVLLVNGGDSGIIAKLFDRLWDNAMQTALDGL